MTDRKQALQDLRDKVAFQGTNEQLVNALHHMATKRPITLQEKGICLAAADFILIAKEETP